MVLCLGEPPRRFLLLLHLHFIFISFLYLHFWHSFHFWSSFVDVLHFVVVSSFVDVLHFAVVSSHFLLDIIPHPSVDYRRGFYTPFYTFSPAHHRVICDTFIFQLFLLTASATVLSGHFLPTVVFYLTLLHRHFNLHLSRLPWEPAVLPWSLQGFILILETQTQPICLFDSQ